MIGNISIIGLGLMGGSMAKALKHRGFKGEIMAFDLEETSLNFAMEDHIIDYKATSLEDVANFSDLIIISTPISSIDHIANQLNKFIQNKTIIIDLSSVKSPIIDLFSRLDNDNIIFIGTHPMTGSDQSGIEAMDTFLYENAYCFICPMAGENSPELAEIEELFKFLGSYPVLTTSEDHDRIVAMISHLPHVIAASLVNTLDEGQGIKQLPFIGGGFRDTTRIAASNPYIWSDIFLTNGDKIIQGIENFEDSLENLKNLIISKDEDGLQAYLKASAYLRKSLPGKDRTYIDESYSIQVSLPDKPGILAQLMNLLKDINIKDIEVLHSREISGAVLLMLESLEDKRNALTILNSTTFKANFIGGE